MTLIFMLIGALKATLDLGAEMYLYPYFPHLLFVFDYIQ